VATNTLNLEPTCLDGSALKATVTSATEFAISAPYACPAATVSGCSSVVLTYNSLSGTLSNGVLSLAGAVTAAGCSLSASANVTFTSDAGNNN